MVLILYSEAHHWPRYKICLIWNQFYSAPRRSGCLVSYTLNQVFALILRNSLSRLAPFISWTLVSFSTLFRHFFTPGSSLGVSGGNGHKYASHTTSLLASHTWNGLLLSFFKKSKASKSLSTLFYERKESLWNDLVSLVQATAISFTSTYIYAMDPSAKLAWQTRKILFLRNFLVICVKISGWTLGPIFLAFWTIRLVF